MKKSTIQKYKINEYLIETDNDKLISFNKRNNNIINKRK